MSDGSKAVFLSYASQDAEAAKRICDALRQAGVEVWFDQSELVGGDAWDQKIRKQIKDCALLIPIVSANTQARTEGYFRLEWRLADQRTHLMAKGRPFLLPVVIDDTSDADVQVPDSFTDVQWTRLRPSGSGEAARPEADPVLVKFVARVKGLLDADPTARRKVPRFKGQWSSNPLSGTSPDERPPGGKRWIVPALVGLVAVAVVAVWFARNTVPNPVASTPDAIAPATNPKSQPRLRSLGEGGAQDPEPSGPLLADAKSVAVLAFANLSSDKEQEYFSDGISEELLNVLAKVPGLKVSARTSAFYFKGKDTPIPEIAKQLGVAYVVEGSVRKSGDKVRITAQLIKASDGFHVWSDTFTRDIKDVFAVQDEIAGLIAKNLELKLGAIRAVEGGSAEIEAYRLYWEARQAWNRRDLTGYDQAEALLNRALALAPRFAKAHAALADVWVLRGEWDDSIGSYGERDGPAVRRPLAKVDEALALDPQSAEVYASRGNVLGAAWQFPAAESAFRTAITLNPNFATAHQWLGRQLLTLGRLDEALAALKRAAELDPLSQRILDNYAWALRHAGRYAEALSYVNRALALQPDAVQARSLQAALLADLGREEEALTALRAVPDDITFALNFRLSALGRLGRTAEIERLLPGIRASNARDRTLALALLGRTTEALAAFKAERILSTDADLALFEPGYDSLRPHPEWNATLARIGLSEAHARAQAWRAAHPPEKPGVVK